MVAALDDGGDCSAVNQPGSSTGWAHVAVPISRSAPMRASESDGPCRRLVVTSEKDNRPIPEVQPFARDGATRQDATVEERFTPRVVGGSPQHFRIGPAGDRHPL